MASTRPESRPKHTGMVEDTWQKTRRDSGQGRQRPRKPEDAATGLRVENIMIMHREIKSKINNFGRTLEIKKNPNRMMRTENTIKEALKLNIQVYHNNSTAAAAKSLQSYRLCVTPQTAAQQAPPPLGLSRQEHWSGSPFPSPMHACTQSPSVMSASVRPHGQQPTRLLCPRDSLGKKTGVGRHFLLQE